MKGSLGKVGKHQVGNEAGDSRERGFTSGIQSGEQKRDTERVCFHYEASLYQLTWSWTQMDKDNNSLRMWAKKVKAHPSPEVKVYSVFKMAIKLYAGCIKMALSANLIAKLWANLFKTSRMALPEMAGASLLPWVICNQSLDFPALQWSIYTVLILWGWWTVAGQPAKSWSLGKRLLTGMALASADSCCSEMTQGDVKIALSPQRIWMRLDEQSEGRSWSGTGAKPINWAEKPIN